LASCRSASRGGWWACRHFERGFGLLDCFLDLEVLDAGDALAAADAVAQPHGDVLDRPATRGATGHRGFAHEGLPTTVISEVIDIRLAVAQFHGHRRPAELAARRATAASAPAGAGARVTGPAPWPYRSHRRLRHRRPRK
jgi:hypothetical protein